MTEPKTAVGKASRQLILKRWFAAPRALVFRAWTDPAMMAGWWGPGGFTTTVEADARPGGGYAITMQAPDGTRYPMHGQFLEIVPDERLVMLDMFEDHPPEWFAELIRLRGTDKDCPKQMRLTVTFEDERGGTLLTMVSDFASDLDRDAFIGLGMAEGMGESFDRLDELLSTHTQDGDM